MTGGARGGDNDRVTDPRFDRIKESLRRILPWVGYGTAFFVAFVLFAYWTFPYDRLRDKIVSDFEHGQNPPPGGSRQALSIGSLEPSWFTGVVLKDVSYTTIPADPSKAPNTMHADEVRARVGLFSIFSKWRDLSLHAKALGGTIDATVSYKKTAEATPSPKGEAVDRTIHIELTDVQLAQVAPLVDAVGARVGGFVRGTIDFTVPELLTAKTTGSIKLELENFGLPGELDKEAQDAAKADPKSADPKDNFVRVHFKVPALKTMFQKDSIALPPIKIGNLPIEISVKNGALKIDKMSVTGNDIDLFVDGGVTLRDPAAESQVNVGLRFKFNDSYTKKNGAAAGAISLLDFEPKLKQGKRPDGFYALMLRGPLGGSLQTFSAPQTATAPGPIPGNLPKIAPPP